MARVLIVGAGGVSSVATHKCAQLSDVFTKIMLASRTKKKCDAIRDSIKKRLGVTIQTAQLDADKKTQTIALIKKFKPDVVVNLALPYQDLPIMDACLATGVAYLDTANYEPPEEATFEYSWQWEYHDRFKKKGILALLGSGFDPGVTNVYCAYALKHHFDEIETVDIIDANAGDHGQPFATNFNPEINIREVTQEGCYWEDGRWEYTDPLSVKRSFDFPGGIGARNIYLMYHEEIESLSKNLATSGLKRMRFWMTFGDEYLTHLRVLKNVGMTRIDPVMFEGREIIPLKFLQALLPQPSSLGPLTKGKTCIGCLIHGKKNGKPRDYYIYNICDHEEAYKETGAQAISYTTGVPAMIGALMMVTGKWKRKGVWNMEDFDPDPFMDALNKYGLPWTEIFGGPYLKRARKILEGK